MRDHRRARILLGLLLAGVLAGCSATARRQQFVNSFVPPQPQVEQESYFLEEPPVPLESGWFASETPMLLASFATAKRSIEADLRLARAEEYFRDGMQLAAEGDMGAARQEFDRAVELLASAPSSLPERARLVQKSQQVVEAIYRLETDAAQNGAGQEPIFDRAPLDEIVELTFPIEPGLKGKVKEQLAATVSALPLELADPVLSYINYFSSPRGKKTLTNGLRRSGRYAPMIRRILDEEGLPQEMIFLAQAESGFLPRAVSRKKATGMWQFVLFRGREYGLMQTSATDDRMDPEKATRAAARHLRDLYTAFGDWYLAIAAYNCGPVNVERAIQRTGYADFWELYKRNALPRETANYLPIILAMTIMAKNPSGYQLDEIVPDPPLEYDTIELSAPTHLALLADILDRSLSAVRELNPAVLKLVAPSGYEIRVPKGTAATVLTALDAIPAARRATWRVHRVSSSESVASIARQYRTTEKSISEANGGNKFKPEEGDLLIVPVAYPGAVIQPKTAARRPAARSSKTGTAKAKPAPRPAAQTAKPGPAGKAYTTATLRPSSQSARNR